MKKICCFALLFLFIAIGISAQTRQSFNLNGLPKNDTLLSGWKFHPGDDQRWVKPGFNDDSWQVINTSEDIQRFLELQKYGIGWIRLRINADSAAAKAQLAAWITQYTASEIYLNGVLLRKYGIISPDQKEVIAYLPSKEPFYIKLNPGDGNVLAVRLAYQPGLPYLSNFSLPLPVFNMYVNNQQSALGNYSQYYQNLTLFIILYAISAGILLIISFIYLVYFLFDRSQKINLYYSLFTLMLCFNAMPNEVWGIGRFGTVSSEMWVFFLGDIVLIPAMLFLLMAVYTLFNYPYRLVLKTLVFIGAAMTIFMYVKGTIGFFVISIGFPVISLLEGCYVCVWAIKRQKKNAGFILAGVVLFILFNVLSSLLDQESVLTQLLFYGGLICFPISMSFYLGVQNSLTNKKLRVTLGEVQMLSAQNLLQEQEKQQILTNQNELLEGQVKERTAELNESLNDLRSTQTQLIQSEKMASLGELTAGIAHEIQNPLNFVNNFSDVNREMIDELKDELQKGDIQEAIAIANDIQQNEEKINHHGKRADAIVKGMLQHSRASSTTKEPTDINKLADEYLRLAYHGLRAKDKSFNAELVTNFAPGLPQVNIVPQDIGRVLLNLFNNAFYATQQKLKTDADFKPEVTLSTTMNGKEVIITVKDNGNGIPDAIKDRIMQPFFTTKPTGEGTGLGLSLSYDIVVKGHGGRISVESKEGEGSTFTIQLQK